MSEDSAIIPVKEEIGGWGQGARGKGLGAGRDQIFIVWVEDFDQFDGGWSKRLR